MGIRFDKHGVELADVAPAGVSRVDPNAVSGNPRHDIRSGKFGTGQKAPDAVPPANVDPLEFQRMMDAVRDAARNFDQFDEGDVQEFLAARARDPSVVDNQAFLDLVKQQRLDDIADLLDAQLRSGGSKPFGTRRVRLSAPRGFIKRAVGGLDADQIAQLMHRLEARGHDRDDVDDFFDKKRVGSPEAKGKRDAVEASDFDPGLLYSYVAPDYQEFKQRVSENLAQQTTVVEMAETLAKNMPAPVVNVTPQVTVEPTPSPAPSHKRVIRDEKGLIQEVIEDAS